jgi:hypothetical protein
MPACDGLESCDRRRQQGAQRAAVVFPAHTDHRQALQLLHFRPDGQIALVMHLGHHVGHMKAEARVLFERHHREQADSLAQLGRQPRHQERRDVGPVRVADQDDALLPPLLQVVLQQALQVRARPVRRARHRQVCRYIEADDRDPRLREHLRDRLVASRPAAVAREQDGQGGALLARGPDLDHRQPQSVTGVGGQ